MAINLRRSFIEVDPKWSDFVANLQYVLNVGVLHPGLLAQAEICTLIESASGRYSSKLADFGP